MHHLAWTLPFWLHNHGQITLHHKWVCSMSTWNAYNLISRTECCKDMSEVEPRFSTWPLCHMGTMDFVLSCQNILWWRNNFRREWGSARWPSCSIYLCGRPSYCYQTPWARMWYQTAMVPGRWLVFQNLCSIGNGLKNPSWMFTNNYHRSEYSENRIAYHIWFPCPSKPSTIFAAPYMLFRELSRLSSY